MSEPPCPRCERPWTGLVCAGCAEDSARFGRWFVIGFALATAGFLSTIASVIAWFPTERGVHLLDSCACVIGTGAAMVGFALAWLRTWQDRRRFQASAMPIARARWRGDPPPVQVAAEIPNVRC